MTGRMKLWLMLTPIVAILAIYMVKSGREAGEQDAIKQKPNIERLAGPAETWSQEEKELMGMILLPCSKAQDSGNDSEILKCWFSEVRKNPETSRQDMKTLASMIERAKRTHRGEA